MYIKSWNVYVKCTLNLEKQPNKWNQHDEQCLHYNPSNYIWLRRWCSFCFVIRCARPRHKVWNRYEASARACIWLDPPLCAVVHFAIGLNYLSIVSFTLLASQHHVVSCTPLHDFLSVSALAGTPSATILSIYAFLFFPCFCMPT